MNRVTRYRIGVTQYWILDTSYWMGVTQYFDTSVEKQQAPPFQVCPHKPEPPIQTEPLHGKFRFGNAKKFLDDL